MWSACGSVTGRVLLLLFSTTTSCSARVFLLVPSVPSSSMSSSSSSRLIIILPSSSPHLSRDESGILFFLLLASTTASCSYSSSFHFQTASKRRRRRRSGRRRLCIRGCNFPRLPIRTLVHNLRPIPISCEKRPAKEKGLLALMKKVSAGMIQVALLFLLPTSDCEESSRRCDINLTSSAKRRPLFFWGGVRAAIWR